ncbi:hypothetical protein [Sphaerisporangium corydalis]
MTGTATRPQTSVERSTAVRAVSTAVNAAAAAPTARPSHRAFASIAGRSPSRSHRAVCDFSTDRFPMAAAVIAMVTITR